MEKKATILKDNRMFSFDISRRHKYFLMLFEDYDKSAGRKNRSYFLHFLEMYAHILEESNMRYIIILKSNVKNICIEWKHSTMPFYFKKYIVILYLHVFGICKFLHDLFSNKSQTKVVLPETLNRASFAHKMAICQLFTVLYF